MGGVGIAKSFGAESGLANPAMISTVKDSEFTFVLTAFNPNVAFKSNAAANAQSPTSVAVPSKDSAANFSVIPELAYATRLSDSLVIGLSLSGTAGMGTDYDDAAFGTASDNGAFRMKTTLSLAKVAVPFSYTTGAITLGIAPILQYGSLQISHMYQDPADGQYKKRDNGASTDIGYGYELGASVKGGDFTVGMVYKSKISMKYDNTISASINDFGGASQTGVTSGDNLDQPAELGLGISYAMGANTIALDYRNIAWGDAAGYKDFNWENQNVYAIGYEYAGSGWALRAGYNYGKSPITEANGAKGLGATGPTGYPGAVQNFFNLSGFPGVVETHMTLGAGYDISDAISLDAAFIYVPEVTVSYNTSGMTEAFAYGGYLASQGTNPANATQAQNAKAGAAAAGTPASSADVTHSQMGLTLAVTYKF